MSDGFLDWQQHDYYALLGVTRMADEEAIRKGFRRKALDCHPDRFPQDSAERQQAEQRFLQLTEARDTLLDPLRREAYDQQQELVQQSYLDAMVSQYQVPVKPPAKPASNFKDTLKAVYQQEDFPYRQADFVVDEEGASYYSEQAEEDTPQQRGGIPEHSRKNAAAFYYSQGLRFAARGQYRRAMYALNNAKMLDPEIDLPPHIMNKIRMYAYYSRS